MENQWEGLEAKLGKGLPPMEELKTVEGFAKPNIGQ